MASEPPAALSSIFAAAPHHNKIGDGLLFILNKKNKSSRSSVALLKYKQFSIE
jgi:hypothetical protein